MQLLLFTLLFLSLGLKALSALWAGCGEAWEGPGSCPPCAPHPPNKWMDASLRDCFLSFPLHLFLSSVSASHLLWSPGVCFRPLKPIGAQFLHCVGGLNWPS